MISCLLKINMGKAYDKVECDYLKRMMETMCFSTKLSSLITECVRSTSFSILVTRMSEEPIVCSKGLRQGDPLSPYLLLLCIEGLISLLKSFANNHNVKGIKIYR